MRKPKHRIEAEMEIMRDVIHGLTMVIGAFALTWDFLIDNGLFAAGNWNWWTFLWIGCGIGFVANLFEWSKESQGRHR